jgi:hypothetical protein
MQRFIFLLAIFLTAILPSLAQAGVEPATVMGDLSQTPDGGYRLGVVYEFRLFYPSPDYGYGTRQNGDPSRKDDSPRGTATD